MLTVHHILLIIMFLWWYAVYRIIRSLKGTFLQDLKRIQAFLQSDDVSADEALDAIRRLALSRSKLLRLLPTQLQEKINNGLEWLTRESLKKYKDMYKSWRFTTALQQEELFTTPPANEDVVFAKGRIQTLMEEKESIRNETQDDNNEDNNTFSHVYETPSTLYRDSSDSSFTRLIKLIVIGWILVTIHSRLQVWWWMFLTDGHIYSILVAVFLLLFYRMMK